MVLVSFAIIPRPPASIQPPPGFGTSQRNLYALLRAEAANNRSRLCTGMGIFRRIFRQHDQTAGDLGYFGLHFVYQETIRLQYKWRQTFPDALDLAFAACHKQVQYATQAAEALQSGGAGLPPEPEARRPEPGRTRPVEGRGKGAGREGPRRPAFRLPGDDPSAIQMETDVSGRPGPGLRRLPQAGAVRFPEQPLPAHFGFQRTASVLEQRKAYEQALEICQRAKEQGWAGNWAWRMLRIKKKLRERGYPVVSMSSSGMSQI